VGATGRQRLVTAGCGGSGMSRGPSGLFAGVVGVCGRGSAERGGSRSAGGWAWEARCPFGRPGGFPKVLVLVGASVLTNQGPGWLVRGGVLASCCGWLPGLRRRSSGYQE
jgi:hypothetical protein